MADEEKGTPAYRTASFPLDSCRHFLSDILALKQIGGISITIKQLFGIRSCAKPSCVWHLRTFETLKVPCFVVTMRTRHQAVEEESNKDPESTSVTASNRKGRNSKTAEATTSSKEKQTDGPKKRKNKMERHIPAATGNQNGFEAADPPELEQTAVPKKSKAAHKIRKGKPVAADLPATADAPLDQVDELQEEIQPKKRRKRGGAAATRKSGKADAPEAAAAPVADTVGLPAAETDVAPEVQEGMAAALEAQPEQAPFEETALAAAGKDDDDDDDEAPEEVSCMPARTCAHPCRTASSECMSLFGNAWDQCVSLVVDGFHCDIGTIPCATGKSLRGRTHQKMSCRARGSVGDSASVECVKGAD